MSDSTLITTLPEAELDHVGAGGWAKFTLVGVVAAVQTNGSAQYSANFGTILSGNQLAAQSNSVNIG